MLGEEAVEAEEDVEFGLIFGVGHLVPNSIANAFAAMLAWVLCTGANSYAIGFKTHGQHTMRRMRRLQLRVGDGTR